MQQSITNHRMQRRVSTCHARQPARATLLHLHLGLRGLVPGDGEVQPHVDDGHQVQEEEGGHQQQGLHHHRAVRVVESIVALETEIKLLFTDFTS